MNLLKDNMVHKTLVEILIQEDGVLILLDDGSNLKLYNNILGSVDGSYIGCMVEDIEFTNDLLIITLNGDLKIKMGMQEDDYLGPEAFFYYGADGIFISE